MQMQPAACRSRPARARSPTRRMSRAARKQRRAASATETSSLPRSASRDSGSASRAGACSAPAARRGTPRKMRAHRRPSATAVRWSTLRAAAAKRRIRRAPRMGCTAYRAMTMSAAETSASRWSAATALGRAQPGRSSRWNARSAAMTGALRRTRGRVQIGTGTGPRDQGAEDSA